MPSIARAHLPRKGTHVVYFIEAAGLVKIGTTGNLFGRVHGIGAASPVSVRLLGYGLGNEERERRLHELLAETHHHNEWFTPSLDLVEWVQRAQANAFAWQRLPPWREPPAEGPKTLAQHIESERLAAEFDARRAAWRTAYVAAVESGDPFPRRTANRALEVSP